MAALPTTKRKHKKRPPALNPALAQEFDRAMNDFLQHVKRWTQRELTNINSNGQTVILPGKHKHEYLIGKYSLLKIHNECWRVTERNVEKYIDFYDRQCALLYCLSVQTKRVSVANELKVLDQTVGRLSHERDWHLHTLKTALNKANWALADIMDARLSNVLHQLDYYRDLLEKRLKWAKYHKTQDGSNETTRTRN